MKRFGFALLLVLATGASAVERGKAAADINEHTRILASVPQVRVTDVPNAILLALKQNDFAALVDATEEDKDIADLADDWDRHAAEMRDLEASAKKAAEVRLPGEPDAEVAAAEPTESERLWRALQSAEGVDKLVAEWQPKLAQTVPARLMEFNLGFGAMLTAIATDKKLAALQVQQLTSLMYAVQDWSGRVDFTDENRLRRALSAVSVLVRGTGVDRFEAIQQLEFEEAMLHGDALLRAIKQVAMAYDLDLDQILNSIRLSEVDADGKRATLHIELRVLGVDLSHDFRRAFHHGMWVDEAVVDRVELDRGEPEEE